MSDLKLVSSNEAIIERIRDGNFKVSDLCREFDLPRGVVRGLVRQHGNPRTKRIKIKGDPRPPKRESAPALEAARNTAERLPSSNAAEVGAETVTAPDRSWDQWILAILIGTVGYGMGAVGVVINWNFAFSYGRTPWESYLLAFIGAGVDFCAVLLPQGMVNLWRARKRMVAMGVLVVWLPCQAFSLVSGFGFSDSNIGSTISARSTDAKRTADMRDELKALRAQHNAITEDRDAKVLDQLILLERGKIDPKQLKSSSDCVDATQGYSAVVCAGMIQLRAARESALKRDALAAKMADLSERIAARPTVAPALPDNIEAFRNVGFAGAATLIAGVLLAIARILVT